MEAQNKDIQRQTIDSYNKHVKEYIDKDRTDDTRTLAYWPGVEYFLSCLEPEQTILEVGSGTGADATRIEESGFRVRRSDVAEGFIQHLQQQGHDVEHYNVLESAPTPVNAVFANAVLLHFDKRQFKKALENIYHGLVPGGYFCFGMKVGDFEGWREKGLSGKRYFKFWQVPDLEAEVASALFELSNTFVTPDADFVMITARRGR
jgi:SAM-dependent methyltransferase